MERLEHRTLLSASVESAEREPVAAFLEPNAPTTLISVDDAQGRGDTLHIVTVAYDDESGVNPASIDTGDITVDRDGFTLNVTEVAVSGSGTTLTALYTVEALGGSWDSTDNGTYTVTVNANAVQDLSPDANGNAADFTTFDVNVDLPLSEISAGLLSTAGATTTVEVIYRSDVPVNQNTIDEDDINVGSAGLDVTGVEITGTSDGGKGVTVVYTVQGPGGSWDSSDNGEYEVSINPGAVRDDNGTALSGPPAFLGVDIAPPEPADETKPSAVIAAVADVTGAGGPSLDVVVTYTDDSAIDLGTINAGDLTVSRDGPGGNLDVTGVSTEVSEGGRRVVATYTVAAPGGSFDADDNGAYSVVVKGGAVRDAAGNGNDETGGVGFLVDIEVAAPPPGDTTPPTASVSAGDLTAGGGASHAVTVTYTDNEAIDVGSIGTGDITVAAPGGGTLTVTGASTSVSDGGKTVVATYTLAAPGGSFDAADNGTYTVTLNENAVRDASGNAAAADSDTFLVNLEPPPPSEDAGPAAVISAAVVAPGAATGTITVVYTDDGRIRANSIGADDLVVTRNGGAALTVTGVNTTSSEGGRRITAVYTVAAPGGTWDAADDGAYTVSLPAGAVTDTQGNGNAAAAGSFTVSTGAQDNADPTAGPITVGDVTAEGVTEQVVTVTYSDDAGIDFTSIGTDDLTVTGPAGTLAVNVVDVAQAADGKSATVTYRFAAPGGEFTSAHNGAYTVSLNAGAVRDTAGKGVAAASATFQAAVPEPTPIDPGFGNGNAVVTNFTVEAVATGAGERVLVAGRTGDRAVVEVRNADGTLDTTFNKTGQLVSASDNAYYAVVAQGDKVVVAGTVGGDFVLVRYHADGRLDTSFGTGGRAFVDFGAANDAAYGLALAPDGKLVAAGQSNGNFAIARFDADGRRDPGFASGGMALIDLGGVNDLAGSVVVQPDGKIILAGTSGTSVIVVRLQANGMDDSAAFGSDSAFSGDGALVVSGLVARDDPAMPDRSIGLALQADGKILVGNHSADGAFGVVRISTSGNIDSAFGNDGLAVADVPGTGDDVDALVVQPTGEILAVGTSLDGGAGRTSIAAFNASGEIISSFGTAGVLTLDSGVVPPARELRLGDLVLRAFGTRQANGRIVVGTANNAPEPQQTVQSALRRLNVPGTRSVAAGTQLGTFGVVNGGKPVKFSYTDADGTQITFMIRGGTGTAFLGADNRINLVVNDGGGGAVVKIRGKGGDGRIAFGDITANGTVKSMAVKNGDLSGTFSAAGSIGKLALGAVAGSICSAGNIGAVTVASLTGAKLLAGTNLGADAEFGGEGASADAFGAATIGKLVVGGQIVGSTIGAGLDPVDATFLDDDDRVIGGSASLIKSIKAQGADEATRFLAGAFGKVKLGAKVAPTADARFRVL